ncbi:MAG: multicopper oxidase family protein, partial [Burkholderiales bacterium]|nr:multicopper oxidase family protein [Burkholderiales bacterium]
RQGERLSVAVTNDLPQDTTIHWHGVRVPNAMDGVPHLTQKPIAPGEQFIYEFDLKDSGSYWYHPHERSHEQVTRGLFGALIVEEKKPPAVDRDVVWLLNDWRLRPDATLHSDFDNLHDMTHAGRIGNTVTLNGRFANRGNSFEVRAGERIRLRLINAASARIFSLAFSGHRPIIIAYDGQAVTPHLPPGERIVLGPATRVDCLVDCRGRPQERFDVTDDFYRDRAYRIAELVYRDEAPLAAGRFAPPTMLPANRLPEPDIKGAARHQIVFEGGAMGGLRAATVDGKNMPIDEMLRGEGLAWSINGIAQRHHTHAPLLAFKRGQHVLLMMKNDTVWHHPIHLHGHSFRVISRNGRPSELREWRDTVLMEPKESMEIAFVADNPGDWMFHCHILQHQQGGMMATLRVG